MWIVAPAALALARSCSLSGADDEGVAFAPRARRLAFGVWPLAFGVRRLAACVWPLAVGRWLLAFAVWRFALGAVALAFAAAARFGDSRALPDARCCVSATGGGSRTTVVGSLSSRKPRKTGWRSLPSVVHSLKRTSATYLGAAQC